MVRKIFYITIFIFFLPTTSLAAPVISGISGVVQDGQNILISGSGFGSGNAVPLLWDNFEAGINGANLQTHPRVGSWTLNGTPGQYSTNQTHGGNQSCFVDRVNNWGGPYWEDATYHQYLYATFWFRWHTVGDPATVKVFQIHGTCQGTCTGQTCGDYNPGLNYGDVGGGWWRAFMVLEKEHDGTCNPLDNRNAGYQSQDAWHKLEAVIKQSSIDIPDGTMILKVDGNDIISSTTVTTRTINNQYYYLMQLFNGTTDGTWTTSQSWLDDLYINDTWSRVMICNGSSFNSAGNHCELQPVIGNLGGSWGANSIAANVARGSFQNDQQAYLYVVDSTGSVNVSGYPITFGDSGGDTISPGNPSGLSVR